MSPKASELEVGQEIGRTQIKDDTLALLALREKAHRAATGASRQGTDR